MSNVTVTTKVIDTSKLQCPRCGGAHYVVFCERPPATLEELNAAARRKATA